MGDRCFLSSQEDDIFRTINRSFFSSGVDFDISEAQAIMVALDTLP
jgi:hypothetical protein